MAKVAYMLVPLSLHKSIMSSNVLCEEYNCCEWSQSENLTHRILVQWLTLTIGFRAYMHDSCVETVDNCTLIPWLLLDCAPSHQPWKLALTSGTQAAVGTAKHQLSAKGVKTEPLLCFSMLIPFMSVPHIIIN